jgi:hypothetical protein
MANKKKPYIKKSVNGEPDPHPKQSHASGSQQSLGDSLIEYNQPESSYVSCRFAATIHSVETDSANIVLMSHQPSLFE